MTFNLLFSFRKLEKQKEKKRKEEQKRKIARLSFNPDDVEDEDGKLFQCLAFRFVYYSIIDQVIESQNLVMDIALLPFSSSVRWAQLTSWWHCSAALCFGLDGELSRC